MNLFVLSEPVGEQVDTIIQVDHRRATGPHAVHDVHGTGSRTPGEEQATASRLVKWTVVFSCACLASYEPLLSLLREGPEVALRYFAEDAFYYLAIARHSWPRGFFTFDQIHATNGFHPLWQFAVTLLAGAFPGEHANFPHIGAVFVVSCALLVAGSAILGWCALRIAPSATLAILAVVPGFFALALPRTGGPDWLSWSWANGMESPLSIFLFSIVLVLLLGAPDLRRLAPPRGLALGTALALLTLARLDDMFLVGSVLLAISAAQESRRRAVARAFPVALPVLILVGAYLAYNLHSTGVAMPISGMAKAGFSAKFNLAALLGVLVPFELLREAWANEWGNKSWRILQLAVPCALAILWLAGSGRSLRVSLCKTSHGECHDDLVLSILAIYVLSKGTYCFFFVELWHQGWWYFPLSLLISNFIIARTLQPAVDCIESPPLIFRPGRAARLVLILVTVAAILSALALLAGSSADGAILGRYSPFRVASILFLALLAAGSWSARDGVDSRSGRRLLLATAVCLWVMTNAALSASVRRVEARGEVDLAFLRRCGEIEAAVKERDVGAGVLAFDDGLIAACFSMPALNGIGLALDPEAYRARKGCGLLSLAWSRGFRVLGGRRYLYITEEAIENPKALRDALRRSRYAFGCENLDAWQFELLLQDRATGTAFVAFAPATGDAAPRRIPERRGPAN